MKTKLTLLAALAIMALPAIAQDPVVLTPTKLYDLIEAQGKRIKDLEKRLAHQDRMGGVYQTRILGLEKKVSHITNILKLKQENGK